MFTLIICLGVSIVEPCGTTHNRVYTSMRECKEVKSVLVDFYGKDWFKEIYCTEGN